jgi:twitching motility protein PilI
MREQDSRPNSSEARSSWLDIESGTEDLSGGCRWLVNPIDAGEVLPLPTLTSVPLTKPWFAGVANIRGTLFSIVDFALWRGGEPTPRTAQTRLLLMGARDGLHSALLVQRVWGLRRRDDLQVMEKNLASGEFKNPMPDGAVGTPAWQGVCLQDPSTQACWTCLDIPALLATPNFLDVAR